MSTIPVRRYKKGDEKQIVELLDSVFHGWPDRDLPCSNLDHWKWKYLDTPTKKNYAIVAESDDDIIGCTHGSFIKIKIGSNVLLCGQGTDAAVHINYRGTGVYSKLADLKTQIQWSENQSIEYGIAENPLIVERAKRRSDIEIFPYRVQEYARIIDIKKHLIETGSTNALLKELGYRSVRAFEKTRGYISKDKEYSKGNIEIKDCVQFDERIDSFWSKIKDRYSFIIERSHEYMNWRYRDPRAGIYNVKTAELNEEIIGYIVTRVNKYKKYWTAYIIDLLTLSNENDVGNLLLEHALNDLDDQDVNITRFWALENHPLTEIVRKQGFLPIRKDPISILIKPLHGQEEYNKIKNLPIEQIHFQIGDTEWM